MLVHVTVKVSYKSALPRTAVDVASKTGVLTYVFMFVVVTECLLLIDELLPIRVLFVEDSFNAMVERPNKRMGHS